MHVTIPGFGNVLAVSSQHIREHLPTRDTGMHTVDSENHEDSRTSILENKPREEFRPFNNNNDNKYLHKKFKKMASAVLQQDGAGLNHITNLYENIAGDQSSSQPSSYPTPRRSDPPASNQNVSARATTVAPNKFSAVKNNEIENNVQINRKDYNSDKSLAAVGAKSNPNVDRATDPRDAYETSSKDSPNVAGNGRHVCPYCNLSCAKPSVLQKHIRAHTNERPYPCVPCGFAFKTKSNLYKHCRSRSHALRLQGKDETPNNEEDWSLGSEADAVNPTASKPEPPWSVDRVGAPPEPTAVDDNPATDSLFERLSPSNSTNLQVDSKPKSIYKPKFHKASFYQEEEDAYKNMLSPSPEFLNRRISKIILDNEAIVDMRDSHLHRKIGKDNVNHKVIVENHLPDPSKIDNQPLNLTKNSDAVESNRRKRCYSESVLVADSLKVPQHPLNPEGSIIKDLLLKARAQANGLLPASSETYDAAETLYVCPLCQISFKSAENLDTHRSYYCKNSASTLNQNAILNISNSSDLLKFPKPEFMYMRSNSCHVTLSDASTTNVASKYSNAVLKSPLKRANKPENLVILRNEHAEVSAPLPSPGPLLGNTRLVDTQSISESMRSNLLVPDDIERINRISPALKRRTESQSSESMSSLSKFSEESYQRSEIYSPPNKIRCVETPATLRSLEELSLSPMRQNSTSLQMFGGEVKITDNAGGTTTMRIEATSQQSPTMISQSRISPSMLGPETSSVLVRSGLHSGATIVHNPTPKEPLPSPHPQTPRLLVSIAPNLATPNYTVAGIPPPNMSKFQFPIGPITAFNPLTLPALSPVGSPSGAATILHCGKYIPYVPGMPGPNSLNSFASPTQKLSMKSMDNGMSIESIMSNEFAFKERLKSLHMDNESKSTSPIYSHSNMTNSNYMFDRNDSVNKYVDSGINRSKVIPGVKLNFGDSQQTNLKSSKSINFNKKLPQNKIDEILKRNTEILLNSSTNSSDFNMKISKNDLKAVSPDKIPPKNSEDNPEVKFHKEKKSCEMREYNFENLISKSEILNKPIEPVVDDNANQSKSMMDDSTKAQERSETSYFKKNVTTSAGTMISDSQNSKFLRPTSLPLKPGTFTPKRHHGITPNANTLPLISPETPRPAKAYGQLYLNGHAYTYLGLKCSTKVYYCTLNRPQPTYVPEQHSLSMYSNWQVCSESAPHPLGLSPGQAMCLYDSRHRPQNCVVSKMKQDHLMTHSSQWAVTAANQTPSVISDGDKADESRIPANELNSVANKTSKSLAGGFESNEEYIYVPGRGRGRYVCSECGIRCKKPSMLKKHIRTHTDVRPFTCKHCSFSFKTKGNLTKHMKSKAHYRKCCELGISPLEGVDGSDMSHSLGDSDDDSDTHDDGNEGETESSDTDSCKSRQEHEAAHCLLSLWGGRPAPGLLSTARPTTYPYTPNTSNHSDVLSITEDSKLPETSFSPIKETASVIRKHPITPLSLKQDKSMRRSTSIMSPIDLSKPMDLSRNDAKDGSRTDKPLTMCPAEDILTPVGEPDLLASLAMSTSKYSRINNWNDDDEPMLQAYLTEKALQDSRIKQCQYTNGRIRRDDIDMEPYRNNTKNNDANLSSNVRETTVITSTQIIVQMSNKPEASLNHMHDNDSSGIQTLAEIAASSVRLKTPPVSTNPEKKSIAAEKPPKGTENAKFVASEYLKVVRGKSNADVESYNTDVNNKGDNVNASNIDDNSSSEKDGDVQKINAEHFGVARKVVVGEGSVGFKLTKLSSEYSTFASLSKGSLTEDGRSICVVCNKTFSKPSQLLLHINIHYIERPFRCSACAVSFRTRGHLQKHERSGSHHNKVSMTSTFGTATTTNPRPFKCSDCKIAFRIHGHLAKHLRSKMHVMRLECLGKLPFGTFAEIERAGVSLTDIDTTDCDNSLASLQILAQKLHEKDPTKLDKWDPMTMTPPLLPPGHESSDEEEPSSPMAHSIHMGDHDARAVNDSDSPDEINVKYSATNT